MRLAPLLGPDEGRRVGHDAELQLNLVRALLTAGRLDEARARITRSSRRRRRLPDDRPRALVLAAEVEIAEGDFDARRRAGAALARSGDDLPEVRCAAFEVLGRAARLRGRAGGQRRSRPPSPSPTATISRCGGRGRCTSWGPSTSTHAHEPPRAARRAAVRSGAPATVAVVDFHLAEALVARGRIHGGARGGQREAAGRRLGSAVLAPALVTLGRSYAHERRVDRMEEALTVRPQRAGRSGNQAGAWGRARAMLGLHDGDCGAALDCLERAVGCLRTLPGHHFPALGAVGLLRTVDSPGRPAAAARDQAATAAGADRGSTAACSRRPGVAAGQDGYADIAADRWTRAVEELRGYVDTDWLVHLTSWLVAPAALRDGWGRPLATLQDAVRWFAAHGTTPLATSPVATSCRTLLRDAGGQGPRRGRGAATIPPTLVAAGISSREADVLSLLQRRCPTAPSPRRWCSRPARSRSTWPACSARPVRPTGKRCPSSPHRRPAPEARDTTPMWVLRAVNGESGPTDRRRRPAHPRLRGVRGGAGGGAMDPVLGEPFAAAPDTHVIPTYWPVPNVGVIPMNAFVIRAAEPGVDTGTAALSDQFVEDALESILRPAGPALDLADPRGPRPHRQPAPAAGARAPRDGGHHVHGDRPDAARAPLPARPRVADQLRGDAERRRPQPARPAAPAVRQPCHRRLPRRPVRAAVQLRLLRGAAAHRRRGRRTPRRPPRSRHTRGRADRVGHRRQPLGDDGRPGHARARAGPRTRGTNRAPSSALTSRRSTAAPTESSTLWPRPRGLNRSPASRRPSWTALLAGFEPGTPDPTRPPPMRRSSMSTDHHRLFRMEGRMTELVTVGLFGEGLRMYNSFEGRIVAGEPAGTTVRGVDVFTIRPDGVGIVDGRELVTTDDGHLTADLTGYSHPPAGLVMPPLEVILDPGFCWPDVDFTLEVAAIYRAPHRIRRARPHPGRSPRPGQHGDPRAGHRGLPASRTRPGGGARRGSLTLPSTAVCCRVKAAAPGGPPAHFSGEDQVRSSPEATARVAGRGHRDLGRQAVRSRWRR